MGKIWRARRKWEGKSDEGRKGQAGTIMKVSGSRPTSGITSARPVSRAGATKPASSTSPTNGVANVADAVRVVGVPAAEMTPRVQAAIAQLLGEVASLKDELDRSKRRIEELEREADEDTLLPVLNRRAFVRELTRTNSMVHRYNHKASLIYIDLNNFKEINDQYGHAAGDAALKYVGDTVKKNIRDSDFIGRLGGDEFAVVLTRANKVQAERRVEVIATLIERRPPTHEGKTLPITIAFGVSELAPDTNIEQTIATADQAMYEHKKKKSGKPRNGPAKR